MADGQSEGMVWRQGYYEKAGNGDLVWRRGSYAARGAAVAAMSTSNAPPTSNGVSAAAPVTAEAEKSGAEPEVGEDCGCGEAVPLGDLKASLKADIEKQAQTIKDLKGQGVKDKAVLQPDIDKLLELKTKWQAVTGSPWDPPKKGDSKAKAKAKPAPQPAGAKGGKAGGKNSADGDFVITARAADYSKWYQDVITAAEMVDQSPVKGCMVIRPWGMAVWDELKDNLNKRIKAKGVQNAYFPLFIPLSFLSKEAEHVEGFAKECAVVTHHRLRGNPDGTGLIADPEAKLEEPLIVRPTSETIIWDMMGKWISSYRDLPLKINQWANVVRWEMRTRPFLRSSEFLWQEGHTAHATSEEADGHAREMLGVYEQLAREVLAVPVVTGAKSPSERFAGADATYTIEALMQNGWALQSGTSHFLGQNFARAFDVKFQTKEQTAELVWATSWGVSTRLLGALVMTHSDDSGLVLPPAVAPHQLVVVPVGRGKPDNDAKVDAFLDELSSALGKTGVRFHIDMRDMKPGPKFYDWERKGVPLRLEVSRSPTHCGLLSSS
jgi:prolyl-tRNA synthetase